MSESTTQCPHCQTTFRVTAAQLQAAAGAVRCGSCQHLFDATAHAPATPADSELPQPEPPSADTPPPALSDLSDRSNLAVIDDDDAVFDDGFEDEQDAMPEAVVEHELSAHRYDHSFLDLDDWEEEPRSIFSDIDEIDRIGLDDGLDAELGTEPDRDEQWAHQLLRELEEEEREQEQRESQRAMASQSDALEPEPAPEPENGDAASTVASDPGEVPIEPDRVPDTPMRAQRDEALIPLPQLRAEPRDGHRSLLQLEPEPLHLSRNDNRSGQRSKRLYGLLALLAAAALGAQYLFFNFDQMALGPQRDRIIQLCAWLGCELPQRSAPELIRTGSLMVRSHPDRTNALVVDAIITNQAAFPQPYPALRLVFSDLNGALVAARSFQPHEYLAGELSGSAEMTSRQPVHIALELVDPGPRAVNYELYLESAADAGSTPRP